MATAKPKKRKKNRGRYAVPVQEAIRLYDKLGSWEKVAKMLKRPDGTHFTAYGIYQAVRWFDQGYAGTVKTAQAK